MATASIDLPNGAKVQVEGTAEDINKILAVCGAVSPTTEDLAASRGARTKKTNKTDVGYRRPTVGAMPHLRGLINESFFKEKRSLSDVQLKLEELGHIYPLTHLSTPLRRLVRASELRRMREGKNWIYVNA